MVFRASNAPSPQAAATAVVQQLPVRVESVDIESGALLGTPIVTTTLDNTPNRVTIRMDNHAIPASQRRDLAARARGSFYGGSIDHRTQALAERGDIVVAEDARQDRNNPSLFHARWLVSMGQPNRVIHGPANLQTYIDDQHRVAVGRFRVWSPALIPAADHEKVRMVRTRLAKAARRSQLPGNATDPATGKIVYGSSLRRYVFMMLAMGPGNQLLERSHVLSVHVPDEWPAWVPEELRYSEYAGETRPRAIPVDEHFLDQALIEFQRYLAGRYPGDQTDIRIALGCDLRPSRDAPIATSKPFSEKNREKLAVIHRENQLLYPPALGVDAADCKSGMGMSNVILGLSPQNRTINDYVMKAVLDYPSRHLLECFISEGQPIDIPKDFIKEYQSSPV